MYFGVIMKLPPERVAIILLFSLSIGIAGSSAVAWFGIRVNTFANSRTAFAALEGKPFPCYAIPLKAGMSIGMLLISVELALMLGILTFMPGEYAGSCFIGFAIGESLGASALRIAGGIFTKIADIGSDLMKIVFKIKEDDARNPGVIADCTGDNAGDKSVGPSADGFETYGVTGVALIVFILLATVSDKTLQVQLLVWIFGRMCRRGSGHLEHRLAYFINERHREGSLQERDEVQLRNAPLTVLVWITSLVSVGMTFIVSKLIIPELGGGQAWWHLSLIITCGTLAGAIIPEVVKVFTSTRRSFTMREVVTSSREGGGALSLNTFSPVSRRETSAASWMGIVLIALMGTAYYITKLGVGTELGMILNGTDAAPVFAFGLVAFGFLGMGPVTIAVDSYGPVTDNAHISTTRLSTIRTRSTASKRKSKRLRLQGRVREGQALPRRERRRGQHVQSHGETRAHRNRRRRRDHDDLLDHRRPHQEQQQVHGEHGQALASSASAVLASGLIAGGAVILLVHRRVDALKRCRPVRIARSSTSKRTSSSTAK